MALNAKQSRFVEEYLVDCNATQAAIRAGYSADTAGQQGERLLKHVEVAAAIRAGRQRLGERTSITAARVLEEYARVAFANLGDYFRALPDGSAVVDLSATSYLDSAGINLLFALGEQMRGRQQQLTLVVAEGSPIARMVSLTGLDRAIGAHPTLHAALDAL